MSEKNDNDTHYHELSGSEARAKVAELIAGMHIAMMTTLATDGRMSSRPMAVQDKPFHGTLWFLTRVTSEKVDELKSDSDVIKELWNPMYKAWFPKGDEDPEIAVLRVDITEGDYWEATGNKVVMMAKYAFAAATGGKVPLGDAGHVAV
jgi:general stress protein 26